MVYVLLRDRALLYLFYLLILLHGNVAERKISMENYDCVHMGPFQISDNELVMIVAKPRQDISERNQCRIDLKALPGRRFKVYIMDMDIKECGVSLNFYEKELQSRYLFRHFDCNSSPGSIFTTRTNHMILELLKTTSSSTVYGFRIRVATDRGPRIDISKSNSSLNLKPAYSLSFKLLCIVLVIRSIL